jgi:hypothetical protein
MARERLASDRSVKALAKLYQQAEANLRITIKAAIDSNALGTAAYRERQLTLVRAYLSALQDRGVPMATSGIVQAYRDRALKVDADIGVSGGFGGIHNDAAKVLADNLAGSLNDAAELVGRQVEDVFRSVGLKQTALGVLEGNTRLQVTKGIVDDLLHEGVTGFVDNAGRRWTLGNYAEMAARTTTREAASAGTANRMAELDLKLITISDHGTLTELCKEYEGKTFALPGESVEGYETIDQLPPFHPNCEHTAGAAAENLDLLTGGAVTA